MKLAEDKGCELSGLTADDLKPLSEFFEADVAEVWSFEKRAEMRDSEGGTSSSTPVPGVRQKIFLSRPRWRKAWSRLQGDARPVGGRHRQQGHEGRLHPERPAPRQHAGRSAPWNFGMFGKCSQKIFLPALAGRLGVVSRPVT